MELSKLVTHYIIDGVNVTLDIFLHQWKKVVKKTTIKYCKFVTKIWWTFKSDTHVLLK